MIEELISVILGPEWSILVSGRGKCEERESLWPKRASSATAGSLEKATEDLGSQVIRPGSGPG